MAASRERQKGRLQASEDRVAQLSEELQRKQVEQMRGGPFSLRPYPPASFLASSLRALPRQRCRLCSIRCGQSSTSVPEICAPAAALLPLCAAQSDRGA